MGRSAPLINWAGRLACFFFFFTYIHRIPYMYLSYCVIGGLDGDWWWAGLKHYTPGLKMDPTPALVKYIDQHSSAGLSLWEINLTTFTAFHILCVGLVWAVVT